MTTKNTENQTAPTMTTLPGDAVRQIMWRYNDRYDLQMLIQSTRSVARGLVARLVADGARHSHDWTSEKAQMLKAFDETGLTAAFMEPEFGGYIAGPKNMVVAMIAYELAWVDAGAATCNLANNLALAPIHEKGTHEQRQKYLGLAVPPQPGEKRETWRGSFVLTEPLPYVGVDTGVVSGKMRVAEWKEGKEPVIQVEKRGRFITNMGYANFVTAAVDSDDDRIKGSCMVILEKTDPGIYDHGSPTHKLVHQLSSTCDPIFSLKVPASRIIGGYTVKDGKIIPNFSHGEVIEAVFRRTRVTVGLMSAAKLMSAIEPVIRYQRCRFRGGASATPGTPRYELGLQQKEDATQRLVDVWATAEAASSLGFATARLFDEFDAIERQKDEIFEKQGIKGPRAQMKAFKEPEALAHEYLKLLELPEAKRDKKRFAELQNNTLAQYLIQEAIVDVICPACKLWNTGYGANVMREAVSLMGGYGITEDCPGYLGHKWMDAQLEATYEGPEAVQRRQLSVTMTRDLFIAQFKMWIREMRRIADTHPGTGACTLASAMTLWLFTMEYLQSNKDAFGKALYHGQRHGVTFPLADALSWLLASRYQILDVLELEAKGPENPVLAEGLPGLVNFFTDLCHTQAARAAGEAGRICAELVYGYNLHPSWKVDGGRVCFTKEQAETMEGIMSGVCGLAEGLGEVVSPDGSHAVKAGPCVCFDGKETFQKLRNKLDGCLTGARLAKDRAADAVSQVMIPEALDYPS
jgi:alkylation response protein AidB-like acyl-CoA dehydrogenase